MHRYVFVFPIVDPDGNDTLMRISVDTEKALCRRRLWRGFRKFMKDTFNAATRKDMMRKSLLILHTTNFYVSDERVEQFIRNISEDYDTAEDIPDTVNQSTDIGETELSLYPVQEGLTTTQTS